MEKYPWSHLIHGGKIISTLMSPLLALAGDPSPRDGVKQVVFRMTGRNSTPLSSAFALDKIEIYKGGVGDMEVVSALRDPAADGSVVSLDVGGLSADQEALNVLFVNNVRDENSNVIEGNAKMEFFYRPSSMSGWVLY